MATAGALPGRGHCQPSRSPSMLPAILFLDRLLPCVLTQQVQWGITHRILLATMIPTIAHGIHPLLPLLDTTMEVGTLIRALILLVSLLLQQFIIITTQEEEEEGITTLQPRTLDIMALRQRRVWRWERIPLLQGRLVTIMDVNNKAGVAIQGVPRHFLHQGSITGNTTTSSNNIRNNNNRRCPI